MPWWWRWFSRNSRIGMGLLGTGRRVSGWLMLGVRKLGRAIALLL